MKIAILQSNYIPWKGYFDIIRSVDEFIIYDVAQYTRRDWRNRNLIKTQQGVRWLTIPVKVKGRFEQRICDTRIHGSGWAQQHWKSIVHSYRRSPYFKEYSDIFEETYKKASDIKMLSEVNLLFIETICTILGIKTKLSTSLCLTVPSSPGPAHASQLIPASSPNTDNRLPIPDYSPILSFISHSFVPGESNSDKILHICRNAGATAYLTGPAGMNYLEPEKFKKANISIVTADYSGYPEYRQQYGQFENNVSVIDLLFNTGNRAPEYMKRFI